MSRDVVLLDMAWGGGETLAKEVSRLALDMEVLVTSDEDRIRKVYDRITIAVAGRRRSLLGRAPRLEWMQIWSAGADFLRRDAELVELPFVLTNASGVHAVPISEHIMALTLFWNRNLRWAVDHQREHVWDKSGLGRESLHELDLRTMLIVGLGAIGLRTARLAKAFGMHVIGLKRHPEGDLSFVDELVTTASLYNVLPRADYIVNTLPHTDETHEILDARAFDVIKPSAYLANIGRGKTIDEKAMILALQEGRLAGAGLDVVYDEPLDPDSPLWDMPNVIITSHYSGFTPEYNRRASEIFMDNLERFLTGRPLRNVVNKKLGY